MDPEGEGWGGKVVDALAVLLSDQLGAFLEVLQH